MGWETAESSGVLECIAALRLTNEATSWSSSSLVRDPGLDAAAVAVALEALRKVFYSRPSWCPASKSDNFPTVDLTENPVASPSVAHASRSSPSSPSKCS
ncbi:hypothetical protein FRC08_015116 [Ceratobasidium sp. 394]|nr:hypothetical protein FRC08_015116 [Ceratobasidium sp. 394]